MITKRILGQSFGETGGERVFITDNPSPLKINIRRCKMPEETETTEEKEEDSKEEKTDDTESEDAESD